MQLLTSCLLSLLEVHYTTNATDSKSNPSPITVAAESSSSLLLLLKCCSKTVPRVHRFPPRQPGRRQARQGATLTFPTNYCPSLGALLPWIPAKSERVIDWPVGQPLVSCGHNYCSVWESNCRKSVFNYYFLHLIACLTDQYGFSMWARQKKKKEKKKKKRDYQFCVDIVWNKVKDCIFSLSTDHAVR